MKTYYAIVDQDEGSATSAWFPDVESCYSASDEPEGMLAAAVEALRLHLREADAPEASEPAALVARKDVADALRDGAWMLAVPYVNRTVDESVRLNISMERGVLDAVDSHARTHGMSRSAFLAQAALAAIEGRQELGSG